MRLVSPHQSLMFASVTGSVDAAYDKDWLVDGRPNYPVRTTGNLSLALALSAAQNCDVFAVCHHAVREAATINLTGDVTNTIPTAAYPPDGIPHNWFRLLDTPVAVDALTVAVTGNTDPVIIGEFFAGLSWQPEVELRQGRELEPGQVLALLGEHGIQMPYDSGVAAPRGIRGELGLTAAEWTTLKAMHAAQRKGTRPSLFIPDDAVNDAWLCVYNLRESLVVASFVTIEILEIPRLRWPA